MTLNQYALLALAGSDEGAVGFVESLPADVRAVFGPRVALVRDLAFDRMLSDPVLFMAFKVPDPLPELGLKTFQEVLDPALSEDMGALKQALHRLNLDELYVLYSASGRLAKAWEARPLLKGAPIVVSDVPPLPQTELF